MFLIKGINKSGDWESRIIECRDIPEAIQIAKESYNIIYSIRYYSTREECEGSVANSCV